ncbi:MAG: DUF3298 domain-containing protein [Ignavibacteria bacterium]
MNKLILTFLLLCFTISSCGKEGSETDVKTDQKTGSGESKNQTGVKSDNIEFVMKEFFKSYNNCNKDSAECAYVSFKYPEILNEDIKSKVNGTINSYLKDSIYSMDDKSNKDFNDLAVNFLAEYDTMKKISDLTNLAYALDVNSEITSETKKDFTVSISFYIFTGGAHPNSFMRYFVFNKKSGNEMLLNDLFKPGYDSLLNKLVDEAYRKEKGLSPTDDLQIKGDLFENKITFNNNFAVTNDSIKFFYNNYEIAAYVFGSTEISIPLSNLKEYLKEQ